MTKKIGIFVGSLRKDSFNKLVAKTMADLFPPGLVVSVSPGAISGFGANHHLRQSLVFLNVPTLQQPEAYIGGITNLIGEDGKIIDGTVGFLQSIVDAYVDFFNRLTA